MWSQAIADKAQILCGMQSQCMQGRRGDSGNRALAGRGDHALHHFFRQALAAVTQSGQDLQGGN
ncbi:hypothetical protein QWA_18487, partial [Alcaligenes faecalis subsp. faecalis NCIB 8687]